MRKLKSYICNATVALASIGIMLSGLSLISCSDDSGDDNNTALIMAILKNKDDEENKKDNKPQSGTNSGDEDTTNENTDTPTGSEEVVEKPNPNNIYGSVLKMEETREIKCSVPLDITFDKEKTKEANADNPLFLSSLYHDERIVSIKANDNKNHASVGGYIYNIKALHLSSGDDYGWGNEKPDIYLKVIPDKKKDNAFYYVFTIVNNMSQEVLQMDNTFSILDDSDYRYDFNPDISGITKSHSNFKYSIDETRTNDSNFRDYIPMNQRDTEAISIETNEDTKEPSEKYHFLAKKPDKYVWATVEWRDGYTERNKSYVFTIHDQHIIHYEFYIKPLPLNASNLIGSWTYNNDTNKKLTLNEDGSCVIHLNNNGDLKGTWSSDGETLDLTVPEKWVDTCKFPVYIGAGMIIISKAKTDEGTIPLWLGMPDTTTWSRDGAEQ